MRPCLALTAGLTFLLLATGCGDEREEAPPGGVALYDYVPGDAAYAMASGEPLPADLRAKLAKLSEAVDASIAQSPNLSDDEKRSLRLVYSLSMATSGGSPAVGLSPDDEWVVYGANLAPRLRSEVSEPDKLRAAIDAAVALSEGGVETGERDGQTYWRGLLEGGAGGVFVGTLRGGIFSVGFETAERESDLIDELIALPTAGGGDAFAKKLADVRETHGFAPQVAGFVDVVTLVSALPSSTPREPACTQAIEQAAAGVPRIALGYTEASASELTMRFVAELSEEAARDLAQWPVSVPGLGRSEGVFSLGFGFDLSKTATAVSGMREMPLLAACGSAPEQADPAALAQATTMLTLAGSPRGLNVVLDEFPQMQGGQVPELRGAAVAVLDNPEMALGMMSMIAPQAGALKLDGEPMELTVPVGTSAQTIAVAASGKTLVAAFGPDRTARAKAALAAAPSAEGTVLSMTGAMGDLMTYSTQMSALAAAGNPELAEQLRLQQQLTEAYSEFFGSTTTTLSFRPEGIVLESSIGIR